MMVRRETIESIGGFDEGYFLYYEETDFCMRARRAGWQCWYVPGSRVMHALGHSTGVSTPRNQPSRLPGYWFESRRRYFFKNHGLGYAAAVDLAATVGSLLGTLKRRMRGEMGRPFYVRDLLRHSVLLARNTRAAGSPRHLPCLSGGGHSFTR